MSQPWKLLPLAAVAAVLGALLLMPGGVTQPRTAFADYDCNVERMLTVEIRDLDTGSLVAEGGISLQFSPNPRDAEEDASQVIVDNGSGDDSNVAGRVRITEACATTGGDEYTVEIVGFDEDFQCDEVVGVTSFELEADNTGDPAELFVENCEEGGGATATPTATATTTAGPAATVTTNVQPKTVGCNGTSIVTIQVKDAQGNPVKGQPVTMNASMGSVSPSSDQTTNDSGQAYVFFTAPGNQGGTATITATAGSASGQATVDVDCGTAATPTATATTAPPPTVAPGGIITPPSTGEAGLVESSGSSISLVAVLAFVAMAACGAVAIVKVRA